MGGIGSLPPGQRWAKLAEAAWAIFDCDLAGRVLSFDAPAADAYGAVVFRRRRAGRSTAAFDALIASVALAAAGAAIVTHDVGGGKACGRRLINPWAA